MELAFGLDFDAGTFTDMNMRGAAVLTYLHMNWTMLLVRSHPKLDLPYSQIQTDRHT